MKNVWMVLALMLLGSACRTAPQPSDHTVVLTAVDSATGRSIPISVTAASARIVAVTHTNEVFQAQVGSLGYETTTVSLEHGFSGPVTVIMKKQPQQNAAPLPSAPRTGPSEGAR